jgi:hypothetical protein
LLTAQPQDAGAVDPRAGKKRHASFIRGMMKPVLDSHAAEEFYALIFTNRKGLL